MPNGDDYQLGNVLGSLQAEIRATNQKIDAMNLSITTWQMGHSKEHDAIWKKIDLFYKLIFLIVGGIMLAAWALK